MKKTIIIIATIFCLILVATCFAGCHIAIGGHQYTTTNHNAIDPFDNISIDTDVANVIIEKTTGDCKVKCVETDKLYHSVKVVDGTLVIESESSSIAVSTIGLIKPLSVTIYLPEKEYGTLTISTDTGDVSVGDGFSFETINISADTGNATLNDIDCQSLLIDCDTGDATLKDVVATASLSIDLDTGDIKLTRCDAPIIYLSSDTGNIRGSLLTGKVFNVKTDLGDVDVPSNDGSGGICNIETDVGDVNITIA